MPSPHTPNTSRTPQSSRPSPLEFAPFSSPIPQVPPPTPSTPTTPISPTSEYSSESVNLRTFRSTSVTPSDRPTDLDLYIPTRAPPPPPPPSSRPIRSSSASHAIPEPLWELGHMRHRTCDEGVLKDLPLKTPRPTARPLIEIVYSTPPPHSESPQTQEITKPSDMAVTFDPSLINGRESMTRNLLSVIGFERPMLNTFNFDPRIDTNPMKEDEWLDMSWDSIREAVVKGVVEEFRLRGNLHQNHVWAWWIVHEGGGESWSRRALMTRVDEGLVLEEVKNMASVLEPLINEVYPQQKEGEK